MWTPTTAIRQLHELRRTAVQVRGAVFDIITQRAAALAHECVVLRQRRQPTDHREQSLPRGCNLQHYMMPLACPLSATASGPLV